MAINGSSEERSIESKAGLVAFDFDQTILKANTDHEVINMIEGDMPEEVAKLYQDDNWTDYMQAVFKLLYSRNIKKNEMAAVLESLQFCEGMPQLLKSLVDNNYEVIIISDANTWFISYILNYHGLDSYVSAIFTNPAHFDDQGLLNIAWFHVQDWCKLSNVNICKGQVLEDYIVRRQSERVVFKRLVYVGDGSNDFCPALKLKQGDIVCPRIGYKLAKCLDESDKVKASVCPWAKGSEISKFLKLQ